MSSEGTEEQRAFISLSLNSPIRSPNNEIFYVILSAQLLFLELFVGILGSYTFPPPPYLESMVALSPFKSGKL